MGGARWMNNQRFRIANVRQVREEFDMPDQLLACLQPALDAKANNRTIAMREVFLRQIMLWMARQARIAHPSNCWMPFEELRNPQCVLAMSLHAQWQRLQPLQEEPGIERGDGRSQVAQQLHPRLDNIGQRPQCLDIAYSMIRWIRLGQLREAPTRRPIKFAAIDDNTADRG